MNASCPLEPGGGILCPPGQGHGTHRWVQGLGRFGGLEPGGGFSRLRLQPVGKDETHCLIFFLARGQGRQPLECCIGIRFRPVQGNEPCAPLGMALAVLFGHPSHGLGTVVFGEGARGLAEYGFFETQLMGIDPLGPIDDNPGPLASQGLGDLADEQFPPL